MLTRQVRFFFYAVGLLLLHSVHSVERQDATKRSFNGDHTKSDSMTITVPDEDNDNFFFDPQDTDKFITVTESSKESKEVKKSASNTTTTTNRKPTKRTSSSALSILNRCIDQHLSMQYLGPFFIFAAIIGLINGPVFAFKMLVFSIQFNIAFPSFVCFVTVLLFY